jgi:hypothetical protein
MVFLLSLPIAGTIEKVQQSVMTKRRKAAENARSRRGKPEDLELTPAGIYIILNFMVLRVP